MSSPDRIDRRLLLTAEPALRELNPALADELVHTVDRFLQSTAEHARSPTYRVRLREPGTLPHAVLVKTLLIAGDEFRLADDPDGLGAWCTALAARLGVLLEDLTPERVRSLVFIEPDGALVILPYDPNDATDLDREPQP